MKTTFRSLEHNAIGFPGVKLKWHEDNGTASDPYVVIKGVIQKLPWKWFNPNPIPFYECGFALYDAQIFAEYLPPGDFSKCRCYSVILRVAAEFAQIGR